MFHILITPWLVGMYKQSVSAVLSIVGDVTLANRMSSLTGIGRHPTELERSFLTIWQPAILGEGALLSGRLSTSPGLFIGGFIH